MLNPLITPSTYYMFNECFGRCRWSKIASHFPGRTDNEIKNHWNTKIKKKMKHLGLDPATHEPMNNITDQTESNQITKPNMCSTIKEGEETKEQTLKDEVDIGSLFEMQGNEISISSSSLYSNISRSESSSNFAEDSISLEQWDLTYMTDPLVPWDFFTNLDDNIFL